MKRYAENTRVSAERSQAELARILRSRGATKHGFMTDDERAAVAFELDGRRVRLELSWPSPTRLYNDAIVDPPHGWRSWDERKRHEWAKREAEQAAMQRWRALILVVKAKLEMIADGHSTVEREFMADLILSDGRRVEEWLSPQLKKMFSNGKMPQLLPSNE